MVSTDAGAVGWAEIGVEVSAGLVAGVVTFGLRFSMLMPGAALAAIKGWAGGCAIATGASLTSIVALGNGCSAVMLRMITSGTTIRMPAAKPRNAAVERSLQCHCRSAPICGCVTCQV